jgi:hypothetical protein
MVDESEREDFQQAIRNKGFEPDDFELTEKQDPPQGGGIYAIKGTVTIERKSTGARKSYQAGHGSAWPAEFEDDLESGAFG